MSLLKPLIDKLKLMLLSIVCVVLASTIIVQAYLIVAIIDAVFMNDAHFKSILPMLVLLLIVISIRSAMSYANGRIGIHMATVSKKSLRMHVLNHFTKQPIDLASHGRSGEKVSTLLNVVEEVDSYYRQYLPNMIRAAVVPLTILIVIFTQNWISGLIILITAPFIPLFMAIIGMKTKEKSEQQLHELSSFSGQFLDSLQGLTTLKLFGRSVQEKTRIEKSSTRFREATLAVLAVAFTSAFMMELISMLSMGLIALQLAIGLIIFETIAFGTAFFILLLAPEFYIALKELSSAFHTGRESITAAKKLEEALSEETEDIIWGNHYVEPLPPRLVLRHVSFSYRDKPILQNISATIEANSHVAIVGKSGAGKTTLLNVIARLLPAHDGEILINGESQQDLSESDWFSRISYISQHPYIFSGTIFENITLGQTTGASREEVLHAAHQAGLTDVIHALDHGMDTVVGEGGRGLSGGEKQRLALARAFLKQPSLILFDEPTTGLDLKTEHILMQSIRQLAENATVITVAHRMHTIKQADLILVLDQGKLFAKGTHDELFALSSHYRELVGITSGGITDRGENI